MLLADEPTGELDFRTGVPILELLHEQAHTGVTVVIVTHNREISRVADRVIELSQRARSSATAPRQGGPGGHRPSCTGERPSCSCLRWSWRDLRARWLQVAAIALIIAIGSGTYSGLTSVSAWRYDELRRQLRRR